MPFVPASATVVAYLEAHSRDRARARLGWNQRPEADCSGAPLLPFRGRRARLRENHADIHQDARRDGQEADRSHLEFTARFRVTVEAESGGQTMKISISGKTDRGKKRPNNEDDLAAEDLTTARPVDPIEAENLIVGDRGILLAVCDGVGGRRAGEVASALALHSLSEEMDKLGNGCPRQTLFRTAVENVNERVRKEAKADAELSGMATTLTAAVVCPTRTLIAHVGDSRAYLVRGAHARQLTRDQTFIASLIETGALCEMDAATSRFRSFILQAIGREK